MDSTQLIQQTTKAQEAKQRRAEMAACYARVFLGTDDGVRILEDLREKFGVGRLVFITNGNETFDPIRAALREGERRVMKEIEDALKLGAPGLMPKKEVLCPEKS